MSTPSLIELVFTAVGTAEVSRAVGQVNAGLGDMVGNLGKLAAGALAVDTAWNKMGDAIDAAATFEHLSARTGESVRQLVVLDQAFRNAGLGSKAIANSANMLERALSGVNDAGHRTESAFRRIGTSIAELKPLTYAQQLQVLSDGFNRLANQSDKVGVARELFGRGGGSMLQLLGDPEALARAEQQAGGLADRTEANAAAAVKLQQSWNGVTAKIREFWQAAASQVLPVMEEMTRLMEGLGGIGTLGVFAGTAGPGALLSTGLAIGLDKADRAVFGVLQRMEEGANKAIVRGVSNAMANAVAWTPIALAAAVTSQIVFGVIAAWEDSQVQAIFSHMRGTQAIVAPFRQSAATATSEESWSKNVLAAATQLRDLAVEQAQLQQKAATPAYRRSIGGDGLPAMERVSSLSEAEQKRLDVLNDAIPKLQADFRNQYANAQAMAAQISANQLAALKQSLQPLVDNLPQARSRHDESMLKSMDPKERMSVLAGRRAYAEDQLAHIDPGLDGEYREALTMSLQEQIEKIDQLQKETQKQIDEDAKKLEDLKAKREIYSLETQMEVAKAAGNDDLAQRLKEQVQEKRASVELSGKDLDLAKQRSAAEHQIWQQQQAGRDARNAIEVERTALEDTLNQMRASLAALEADYSRTDAEKWAARRKELQDEVTVLEAQIAADKKAADAARAAGNTQAAQEYDRAGTEKGRDLVGVRGQLAQTGPNPNSLPAQLTAQTTAIRNSMGTVEEQIGKSWERLGETMRSSMGSAFYSMLSRAQNLRQATGALFVSLEQSVGQSASQMAADWVMKHLIMDNARRLFHALGLVEQKAATAGEVGIHAAGEGAKTGATAAGAGARTGIRVTETILHGIQVGIRTALHIAGEVAQTAATLLQSGIRIAATIAEAMASIVKAAAGAMSAMASIPYVGPFLAVAAAAAMIAEGGSLLKGARENGGPVEAGSAYLVGEKRPEIFVPHSDGYIFPDVAAFSVPAPRTDRGSPLAGTASASGPRAASGVGSGGWGGSRGPDQNHYWFMDKQQFVRALASDMRGIAHEVYDMRERRA